MVISRAFSKEMADAVSRKYVNIVMHRLIDREKTKPNVFHNIDFMVENMYSLIVCIILMTIYYENYKLNKQPL